MIKRGWLGLVICLIFVLISLSFAGALWPFDLRDDKTTGFAVDSGVPGDSCKNNSDCSTNLCVSDKCASKSFWNKFVDWVKGMFGVFVYYEENGNNSSTSNLNSPFKIILSSRNKNNAGESNTVVGGGGVGGVSGGSAGGSSGGTDNNSLINISWSNNSFNNFQTNSNQSFNASETSINSSNYNLNSTNTLFYSNTSNNIILNNTPNSESAPSSNNPPSSNNTSPPISRVTTAPLGSKQNPVPTDASGNVNYSIFPPYPPQPNTTTISTTAAPSSWTDISVYCTPNPPFHCSITESDNVCPAYCTIRNCTTYLNVVKADPWNDIDCCTLNNGHLIWYLMNTELVHNLLGNYCWLPQSYWKVGNCNATSWCSLTKDGCCNRLCHISSDPDCCDLYKGYWIYDINNNKYDCRDTFTYGTGSCTAKTLCSLTADSCCPYSCDASKDVDCCINRGGTIKMGYDMWGKSMKGCFDSRGTIVH